MMGTNHWLWMDGHAVERLDYTPGHPNVVWKAVESEVEYAQQMNQQTTTHSNNYLLFYIIIGILVIALIGVSIYAITKK